LTAHLAHGASWAFLFAVAATIDQGVTLESLAWVHLVALGWLTLTALAILLHVIPTFTDNPWRGESLARGALFFYVIGAGGLIASFADRAVALLPLFGGIVALSLLAYVSPAFVTLFVPPPAERTERIIAGALGTTLLYLAVAVALGVLLTVVVRTDPFAAVTVAPIHADVALLGWLSMLVFGVSTRTLRVITGNDARMPVLHIVAGNAAPLGIIATAIGFWLGLEPLVDAGAVALALAAVLYAVYLTRMLAGARNPHRPPQAFVVASGLWLLVAVGLGAGIVFGRGYGSALVVVLLVGWLGQMVVAHLHHIGIRLLATVARGDDDETRPAELLVGRLSWATFAAFQFAVFAAVIGSIARDAAAMRFAAACGVLGWLMMTSNVAVAWRRARA
jgi:hypothetical protein